MARKHEPLEAYGCMSGVREMDIMCKRTEEHRSLHEQESLE